jgi:hypothetical protein
MNQHRRKGGRRASPKQTATAKQPKTKNQSAAKPTLGMGTHTQHPSIDKEKTKLIANLCSTLPEIRRATTVKRLLLLLQQADKPFFFEMYKRKPQVFS